MKKWPSQNAWSKMPLANVYKPRTTNFSSLLLSAYNNFRSSKWQFNICISTVLYIMMILAVLTHPGYPGDLLNWLQFSIGNIINFSPIRQVEAKWHHFEPHFWPGSSGTLGSIKRLELKGDFSAWRIAKITFFQVFFFGGGRGKKTRYQICGIIFEQVRTQWS